MSMTRPRPAGSGRMAEGRVAEGGVADGGKAAGGADVGPLASNNRSSDAGLGLRGAVVAGRLEPADYLGQRADLRGQRGPPRPGDPDPGPRTAPAVALLDLDHARLLQHGEVPGQVPGSEAQRVTQVAELGLPRFRRDREDAEPVPLVHCLVQAPGR